MPQYTMNASPVQVVRARTHSAVSESETHTLQGGSEKLTVDPYVLESALLAHVEARDAEAEEGDGRRRRPSTLEWKKGSPRCICRS